MNQKLKEKAALSRRGFMRMAGFSAGAAGAVAVGLEVKPADAASSEAGGKSEGYRETEHVKTYYAHARM